MAQIDSIIWTEISAITLPLPHKFNIKWEMDGRYLNLWSTDNDKTEANDEVVIKSVYDPSPVGYSLPASNAFTGFTTTGGNVGDESNPVTPEQVNAKFPFDKGWELYSKLNKQSSTLFFPASSWRHYSSGFLNDVSKGVGYWSAGAGSLNTSWFLSFTNQRISPLYNNIRNLGLAVRSAEEVSTLQLLQHTRRLTL